MSKTALRLGMMQEIDLVHLVDRKSARKSPFTRMASLSMTIMRILDSMIHQKTRNSFKT